MNYKFWLANIEGIGCRTIQKLLEQVKSAEEIYHLSREELEKLDRIGSAEVEKILAGKKFLRQKEYEEMKRAGISFITMEDAGYPAKLRNISDPPYALYGKGEPYSEARKMIAIVGARQCSDYGYAVAKELGEKLVAHGAVVVSGMARGIDAGGQWGAVKGGGKTYAVLGCGPDVCYPSTSRNLYAEILNGSGGVLSEYPPKTEPSPGRFPCRNRIIAGLSDAVVVVEAKARSGSLITADLALEQGKDVYAVPGRVHDALSAGCNALLFQGAGIVSDVSEFIAGLGLCDKNDGNSEIFQKKLLEKEERLVYGCLGCSPKSIEELLDETGWKLPDLAAVLAKLLQKEYIAENFKNHYIRRL